MPINSQRRIQCFFLIPYPPNSLGLNPFLFNSAAPPSLVWVSTNNPAFSPLRPAQVPYLQADSQYRPAFRWFFEAVRLCKITGAWIVLLLQFLYYIRDGDISKIFSHCYYKGAVASEPWFSLWISFPAAWVISNKVYPQNIGLDDFFIRLPWSDPVRFFI